MNDTPEDRFLRQRDLVPHERLQNCRATIIGIGAVGRNVAIQLAAIGVRHLQLIDFDHVDLSNTTTQGFASDEIGMPKVQAVEATMQLRNIANDNQVQNVNTAMIQSVGGLASTAVTHILQN